jgi:hypothetical protein
VKQAEIIERLPDVFKQAITGADPLSALIGVMEDLHARDEEILADFGRFLDPRRTGDEWVPYLSWWVDEAWLFIDPPDDPYAQPGRPFPGGSGALRELVASAAYESKWRGTSAGLIRVLEKATRVRGYRIDEAVKDASGVPLPFVIRVVVPAGAERFLELVARIVAHEKPAHVIAQVALEEAGS